MFGGLTLEGADGPVTGRPAQHRRLAVLALLAPQRAAMVSREQVVGYLRPDTHPERARHLPSYWCEIHPLTCRTYRQH